MDQLDRPQSNGAGSGPESVWYILLLDAVCRLYGFGRNGRLASRHLLDGCLDCQFNHYTSDIIPRGDSTHATRRRPRSTCRLDFDYYEKGDLCRLDDVLFACSANLEFCPAGVFILAL